MKRSTRATVIALSLWTAVACATGRQAPADAQGTARSPIELAYAEVGTGPPIVFIHGSLGDLRTYARALPILGAGHRVFALSLRYHWPNPWPASDEEVYQRYTVETHVEDVVALLERLALGPVDLVGHSYGGNVAARVALARPDLVRRLVLLEPALRWLLRDLAGGPELLTEIAKGRPEQLARLRAGEDPVSVVRSAMPWLDTLAPERRRIVIANARTTGPYIVHPAEETRFTCEDARRLGMPLLLVAGEKTDRQYREIVARLAECQPGARTAVLPGSSHVIQADAPEAMARAVLEFLGPSTPAAPRPGP
jgi:pimeloyl-ACP methyl ester carboxylesterase